MLAPVDPVRGWTDRAIIAKVDPSVTGELDQNNVSLVIETASGQRGQSSGFSFYAMRGPAFPLKSIPSSAVCSTGDSSPCSFSSGYISQFGVLFRVRERGQHRDLSDVTQTHYGVANFTVLASAHDVLPRSLQNESEGSTRCEVRARTDEAVLELLIVCGSRAGRLEV